MHLNVLPLKIVSSGQTSVDRAGLDVALKLGLVGQSGVCLQLPFCG